MNKKTERKASRRKVVSAAVAVAMAFTMLLSGTLAYFMQTSATNTFRNTSRKVVGHDDFVNLGLDATTKALKYNKDIYVENLGGEPVFVRVKLTEDFTLNGKKIVDEVAPVAHIPENSTSLGIGTETGDTAGGDKENPAIHDYFTWDMGNGASADTSRTTFLSANADLYTNGANEKILLDTGVAKDNSGLLYDDPTALDENTQHNVQTGLAPAPVITMAEYMAKQEIDKYSFIGWVIDDTKNEPVEGTTTGETVDGGGWAYWSQMLTGGKTTGLLLNGVTVSSKLANEAYTYNIHVDFEVVDKLDKNIWVGTSLKDSSGKTYAEGDLERVKTTGAKKLLEIAEKSVPEDEFIVLSEEILEKKANAKSTVAQNVYDHALGLISGFNKYSDKNSKFNIELMQTYEKIADKIDERHQNPDEQEALAQIVIKLNGTDDNRTLDKMPDSTNTKKIINMNDTLACYLVDKYGDTTTNTLTYEQALGVTDISLLGHVDAKLKQVDSLDGLDMSHFENLLSVVLQNLPNITKIDFSAFTNSGGEVVKGIKTLDVSACAKMGSDVAEGEKYTLDFSTLANTLRSVSLVTLAPSVEVLNLNQLQDLRGLYLCNPTSITEATGSATQKSFMSMKDMNTILKKSPDIEYFSFEKIYFEHEDEEGNKTVSRDISDLDLSYCKNISRLCVNKQFGTLSVASGVGTPEEKAWALTTLKTIDLSGIDNTRQITADLTPCTSLIEVKGDAAKFVNVTKPSGL